MDKRAFKKPFGSLVDKGHYTAFIPKTLPPQIDYDERLTSLVSEASLQLRGLNGIGRFIPNPQLLIRPYLTREAVLSSKIEGTQASIIDIFQFEAGGLVDEEKESKRVVEVVNYMSSLNQCLNDVKNGKRINLDMITKAHKILLHNVRGQELSPGELRTTQNWIGWEDVRAITDAVYVPPPENVKELLDALVDFIQNPPGRIPVLVQSAMIHYLFEAIHPFADGNGRIGRLLILLLFAERNILQYPLLYLSAYFERNKMEYYSLLLRVSQNSEWTRWIIFFLHGIITQSRTAIDNIQKLYTLKMRYDQKLNEKKVSRNLSMAVDRLFSTPIITIPALASHLELTYHGAQDIVDSLKEMGILKELGRRQRNKIFGAQEILEIVT